MLLVVYDVPRGVLFTQGCRVTINISKLKRTVHDAYCDIVALYFKTIVTIFRLIFRGRFLKEKRKNNGNIRHNSLLHTLT